MEEVSFPGRDLWGEDEEEETPVKQANQLALGGGGIQLIRRPTKNPLPVQLMDLQGSLWKTDPPVKHQEKGLLKRLLQPKAVAEAPLVQRERGSAPPVPEGSSTKVAGFFAATAQKRY
ncbi:hypothetical protein C0995_007650 [Termitomyces sp. Mi166|nr:hypothetical protein C0995_007650 [Termitomyces sp. Mi166\